MKNKYYIYMKTLKKFLEDVCNASSDIMTLPSNTVGMGDITLSDTGESSDGAPIKKKKKKRTHK